MRRGPVRAQGRIEAPSDNNRRYSRFERIISIILSFSVRKLSMKLGETLVSASCFTLQAVISRMTAPVANY